MRLLKTALSSIVLGILLLPLSCKKQEKVNSDDLEGRWGLIYTEITEKVSGKIVNQDSGEYNPYNPSDEEDELVDILNIEGYKYMIQFSHWDVKKAHWVSESGQTVIIKNNKVYTEGHEDEATGISASGERLILEASGTYYDEYDGNGMVDYYAKKTYRKMCSF